METKRNTQLVIAKNDFDRLMHFLRNNEPELQYDRKRAKQLMEELSRSAVVSPAEIPINMIRLNSRVVVRNTMARQNNLYILVLPGETDLKQDKISILSPLGMALLGAVKGDTITLPSTRGQKFYTIVEVTSPVE